MAISTDGLMPADRAFLRDYTANLRDADKAAFRASRRARKERIHEVANIIAEGLKTASIFETYMPDPKPISSGVPGKPQYIEDIPIVSGAADVLGKEGIGIIAFRMLVGRSEDGEPEFDARTHLLAMRAKDYDAVLRPMPDNVLMNSLDKR